MYIVERARAEDLQELPAVEREAASLFAGWSVPAEALADTTPLEEFRHAQEAGLLWVARGANHELVGFALIELVDGQPHVEEIDVRPSHARRGVGRSLVETVLAWARAVGYTAVTLTAFQDVPWNAPFYASAGFRTLERCELTPALEAILLGEAARGFDFTRRVVMRCELGAT